MGIILPHEITTEIATRIGKISKNYSLRILGFVNESSALGDPVSTTPITDGDYSASTGVYSVPSRVWAWRFFVYSSGRTVETSIMIEYKDDDGNWIVCHTAHDIGTTSPWVVELASTIFAKDFRFKFFDPLDETTTNIPTDIRIYSELRADVTKWCTGDVTIEDSVDILNENVKLPHGNVGIINNEGQWIKSGTALDGICDGRTGEKANSTGIYLSSMARRGARIVVMIKYYGTEWEDSDWIIIGNFYTRKWSMNSVGGEMAWLAKTKVAPPIIENAEPADVIENIIAMKDGNALMQIEREDNEEIITVENEYVGDIEFFLTASPPSTPEKILDGTKVWCHCQDSTYIYYMIRNERSFYDASTDMWYFDVYRMTHSGTGITKLGTISQTVANLYTTEGATGTFNGYNGQSYSPEGNIYSQIRNACMDCDDEYLYIGFASNCLAKYYNVLWTFPPYTARRDAWNGETVILRVKKVGGNFRTLCPQTKNVELTSTSTYIETITATGEAKKSITGLGQDSDTDSGTNHRPVVVMRCIHSGNEKLLVIVQCENYGGTGTQQKAYLCDPNLQNYTFQNNIASGIEILSMFRYDDDRFCCLWQDNNTSKKYLGMAEFNKSTGDLQLVAYGRAESNTNCRGLSFIGDSIFASGTGWSSSNRSVSTDGVKQAYRCVFIADGSHMIHELHATRNNYLSHRFPMVTVGGADISKDQLEYGVEYVDGEIFYNIGWIINLKTGEIKFRQIFPSSDLNEIRISYDFVNNFLFLDMESDDRMDSKALGKISQAQFGNYFFDEAGRLNKLPFLQQQTLSMKGSTLDYYDTDSDLDEHPGMWMSQGLGSDIATGMEFVPEFSGVIEKIKLPVKLHVKSITGGALPNPWNPIDVDLYITGSGVDCRSAAGAVPDTPPVNANIKSLGAFKLFIDSNKIVGTGSPYNVGDESPYVWRTFDVSGATEANRTVVAGSHYCIIIRMQKTNNNVLYYGMAKDVAMSTHNRTIKKTIPDGADITTHTGTWYTEANFRSDSDGGCIFWVLEYRKDRVALKSTKIIDSLHPNISSGFTSLLGGSDSTIAVKSQDLESEFTKGSGFDYTIEYSSGKFWLVNEGLASDQIVVVQWFDTPDNNDLIKLTSAPKDMIEDIAAIADTTSYLGVKIIGEKLLPAPRSVVVEQIMPLPIAWQEPLEASTKQRVEGDSSNSMRNWNETKKKFEYPDSDTGDSAKFALDFKDPFIAGTTAYTVRYGKGLTTDRVEDGSVTPGDSRDVPLFWRIDMASPGNGFDSDDYHIIFKDDQYRTWRLATSDDIPDMVDNTIVWATGDTGSADSHFAGSHDGEPLKGKTHFYVKHMNKYYDNGDTLNWIAFESEDRQYYIDRYGAPRRDDGYAVESDKNPSDTSYLSKVIVVQLGVENAMQVPLFEAHGESGKTGYDSTYSSKVKSWAFSKLDRVDIKPRGIAVNYSNKSGFVKFLRFFVIGYPLNARIGIEYSKLLDGSDHADAKIVKIENNLIQSYEAARLKGQQIIDFWGNDKPPLSRTMPYNPMLRPGMVIKLDSDLLSLSNRLFFIHSRYVTLSPSSGFTTELRKMIQI